MGAVAAKLLIPEHGDLWSLVVLWSGMLATVILAFVEKSRAGIFRFRFVDLVWGVGIALIIRLIAGGVGHANSTPFPNSPTLRDSPQAWALEQAVSAGLIGPVVEELFFRGVILVAVYVALQPITNRWISGAAATVVSAGLFTLTHASFATISIQDAFQLFTLGAGCSLLVLLTGRISGAVILHAFYNLMFLALTAVGTVLT